MGAKRFVDSGRQLRETEDDGWLGWCFGPLVWGGDDVNFWLTTLFFLSFFFSSSNCLCAVSLYIAIVG